MRETPPPTRARHRLLAGAALAAAVLVALAAPAAAQEEGASVEQSVVDLGQQVNLLWIVIGALLVIFMQAASPSWRPASAGPSTPPTW